MPSNLDNVSHERGLFTMLKGEPGTRKSTCALSYPTPQYWFSIDKKMKALLLPMKEFGIKPQDIEFDDFLTYKGQQNSMEPRLKQLVSNCKYKTIIIDSVTTMGDMVALHVKKMKSGTTSKSGEEKGNRVAGIDLNTYEDYKAEAAAFTEMLDDLQNIRDYNGTNIILISHVVGEKDVENQAGEVRTTRVIITGAKVISGKIPAYCEEIYHFIPEFEIGRDQSGYSLITQSNRIDYARTSLPLPRKISFNNKPIYSEYIVPAIKKLKETTTITKL